LTNDGELNIDTRKKRRKSMTAIVDTDTCVGCGLCSDTCPAVFEMVDGVAKVIVGVVPPESESTCKEAAEGCPVTAIKVE
jgi:ferredoxin